MSTIIKANRYRKTQWHQATSSKISSLFLLLYLVLLTYLHSGCKQYHYIDPLSNLLESDSLKIWGRYNPANNAIDYCYTKQGDTLLHGNFIWNRFCADETLELTRYFNSRLYKSCNYVSGRFNQGELDGEIILMRLSNPKSEILTIDTIGIYNYSAGILHGPFYLSNGNNIRCRGNYHNGKLDGQLYHIHGQGSLNGVELGNSFRWELNYQEGVYDSVQTLFIHDTIFEQAYFNNGRLIDFTVEQGKAQFHQLLREQSSYELNNSSLYFSLLGRMFEKDHTAAIRSKHFGDSIFTGSIKFCKGYICNDSFTLNRLIYDKEGYTTIIDTFYLGMLH